jgi:hypothetical protein
MLSAAEKHCAHCSRELEEQAKTQRAAEQGPLQQRDKQPLPKKKGCGKKAQGPQQQGNKEPQPKQKGIGNRPNRSRPSSSSNMSRNSPLAQSAQFRQATQHQS